MAARTIDVAGETFSLRDKMPPAVVLKFQRAQRNPSLTDADKSSYILDLLQAAVTKADWPGFEAAIDEIEEPEELVDLMKQVLESFGERPTGRSSDSSDGPATTSPKSVSQPGPVASHLAPRMALAMVQAESA